MVERSIVLNAFTPSSEVDEPARFAGRRQQILALADALQVTKSLPLIYGARGLGKTSIALQIARIALGDVELLEDMRAQDRAIRSDNLFAVFWVSCSDATKNKDDLIQRLINTADGYSSVEEIRERRLTGEISTSKFALKVFEREVQKTYEEVEHESYATPDVEEKFKALVETLQDHGYSRLLFVIDELDRVASTDGLASFLKNQSTSGCKFLIVGIGQNISDLLADHASLERSLTPVRVQSMSATELAEIVDRAMRRLHLENCPMSFSNKAREQLVRYAGGFPWFVHVIGQAALLAAWEGSRNRVETWDVEAAVKGLAENKFAQQFSDLYLSAVRDSFQREIVLRLLARWPDEDIPTSQIYPKAERVGVSNPSLLKKQLASERCGSVLVAPPGHARGLVRFRNAMFKRYVCLREALFDQVAERIDKVW